MRLSSGFLSVAVLILAAAAGIAPVAGAEECECAIARLHYGGGGDWYANPSSLPNLIAAVKQRTRLPVCDTVAEVQIADGDFFHYPFVYMTGHGNVHFTPAERVRLRAFLRRGGFLWADDNYGMDESFRREMKAIFPDNPLIDLPATHPVYSCVYPLPGLPKIHEHDGKPAQGMGILHQGRLVVLYTFSSDIGDGMEDLAVHNDGPQVHETALRMGINVLAWFFRQ